MQYTANFDVRTRLKSWNVPIPASNGGVGSEYAYDNFSENTGRVTYAKNTYDPALDRSFNYDHIGRVSESYTANDARAHTGQPGASWTGGGDYAHNYQYDTFGNLTSRNGWGGQSIIGAVAYTAQNQVAGVSYDAAGNPTSDGGSSYTYDATGQQATSAVAAMTMSYDGARLRAKKVENGVTTYYLRSSVLGGAVVAELNGSGGWTRGYVYGDGGLLAIQQENQVEWVHQDPVTKSQRLTNQAGSITASIEVGLWGDELSRSTNSERQPRKYTTYERDANQADDAMHRRYNWWRSRFEQPDPYDGSYNLGDPQSFNRYAYVGNDPVNFTDPTGLEDDRIIPPDEHVDVIADPYNPFNDPFFSDPNYGGRGVTTVMPELPFPTEIVPGITLDAPQAGQTQPPKGTCNIPGYGDLSPERQRLLNTLPGGGASAYNNLNPNQKVSFLNQTGALAAAGVSTAGLSLSAVRTDRLLFSAGSTAAFVQSIQSSGQFSSAKPRDKDHPGMSDSGGRQNRTFNSLQYGVGPSGAFVDIDIGNPNKGFGLGAIVHFGELLNPGTTDPYRVGRSLGSGVTGYACNR